MPTKSLIAIVDDDQTAREGTADLVNSMGFEATTFSQATMQADLDTTLHGFGTQMPALDFR